LLNLAAFLASAPAQPGAAKQGGPRIKEGAFYEFRGHIYDRSTIEHNFTLYWGQGRQVIFVSPDTKIFRHGRGAQLQEIKSGDAVRGVGQVKKGKLVAFAVAFGEEGVELPAGFKVPETITLPPPQSSD
jgi:hypothetical protein